MQVLLNTLGEADTFDRMVKEIRCPFDILIDMKVAARDSEARRSSGRVPWNPKRCGK